MFVVRMRFLISMSFTYVDGQLIITNKTPQSISWGQDFSSVAINQIIDLNASASSNLPVTYAVSDTSKAELAVTHFKVIWTHGGNWMKHSATTIVDSSGSWFKFTHCCTYWYGWFHKLD